MHVQILHIFHFSARSQIFKYDSVTKPLIKTKNSLTPIVNFKLETIDMAAETAVKNLLIIFL